MEENYAEMLEDYLHHSKFPRPVKHVQDNPGFNLTRNVQLTRENQLRLNAMKPLIVGKNIDYLYSNIELKSILDYIIVETLKVCPPNPGAFLSKLFTKEDIEEKLEKQKILIKKKMKSKQNGSLFSLDEVTDWGRVMEELEWEEKGEEWIDKERRGGKDGGEVERIIRGTPRGQGWLSKERNRLGERKGEERRRRSKEEGLECEEGTGRERGESNKEGEGEQERTGRSSGVQGSIGGEELNKEEEEEETGERKRSRGQGWIGEEELNREKETGERENARDQGWIGEEELNEEENMKILEEEIELERTSGLMSKEKVVDKGETIENGVERKSKEEERIDGERIVKEGRNGRGIMKRTFKGQGLKGEGETNRKATEKEIRSSVSKGDEELHKEEKYVSGGDKEKKKGGEGKVGEEEEEDKEEKEQMEGEDEVEEEEENELFRNSYNLTDLDDEFNYFDFTDSDSDTNKSEEEFSCHNLLYIRKPRRHSLFRKDDGFNESKRTPKISFKSEEENEGTEEGEVFVVVVNDGEEEKGGEGGEEGEEGENGGRDVGIQEEEVKGNEGKEGERDGKEEEEKRM